MPNNTKSVYCALVPAVGALGLALVPPVLRLARKQLKALPLLPATSSLSSLFNP
jgi:hypothetical protein